MPPQREAMRTYHYEAVGPGERRLQGTMEATDEQAVVGALRAEGWTPARVAAQGSDWRTVDVLAFYNDRAVRLSTRARAEFCRQMYHLLHAGLPINQALLALAEGQNERVAEMLETMAADLAAGSTLSEVMEGYPKAFDEVFRAYVASGEATGTLTETMGRLATLLDRQAKLVNKIRGVALYPIIVAVLIAGMMVFVFFWLVPMFEDLYAGFDAELPALTQLLVAISERFPWVVGGFLASVAALRLAWVRVSRHPTWGVRLNKLRFKLPVFGRLMRELAIYRWVSTIAGATMSGLSLHEALPLAGRASNSLWHAQRSEQLREEVLAGRRLSEAMDEDPALYPPNVRTMVRNGERAGALDDMLVHVEDYLNDDIQRTTDGLAVKVEVGMILALGVVGGFIVVALFLPLLLLGPAAMEGLEGGPGVEADL